MSGPTSTADSIFAHDRARDGVEHLQVAARELIEAARAMLDVVEGVVRDPEAVASIVGAVGAVGELLTGRSSVPPWRRDPAPEGGPEGSPIERIPVT